MTSELEIPLDLSPRTISSLGLICLAVRENTLLDGLEDLLATLSEFTESDWAIPSESGDLQSFRTRFVAAAAEIYYRGELEEYFRNYQETLSLRYPDVLDDSVADVVVEIEKLLQAVADLPDGELPQIEQTRPYQHHYRIFYPHYAGRLHLEAIALAPWLYLIHLPFAPVDRAPQIAPSILKALDGALCKSMSEILAKLYREGTTLRRGFLSAFIANDLNLLSATMRNEDAVVDLDRFQPNPRLAAALLPERALVHFDSQFIADMDATPYVEIDGLSVQLARLRALYRGRGNLSTEVKPDWIEYALKLVCYQHEGARPEVQGIDGALHAALCDALAQQGRAMSLRELRLALGAEFELHPEDLSAPVNGRGIMAYARHPRFLHKDEAFYVLSDWVESASDKKGRIARDRVVTPFTEKRWEFSLAELRDSLPGEPIYARTNLIVPRLVVERLARTLPGKPDEPYYRKRLTERAIEMLREHAVEIGKGLFAWVSDLARLGLEPTEDDVPSKLVRAASTKTGSLRELIECIDEPGAQQELRRLL